MRLIVGITKSTCAGTATTSAMCFSSVSCSSSIGWSAAFVERFLRNRLATQESFLRRLPQLPDTQTAWLLRTHNAW